MKNLKLFVAPLLGATLLLTACGPKSMDVKAFMEEVGENYKEETLEGYKGKTLKITGTPEAGTGEYKVASFEKSQYGTFPRFKYEGDAYPLSAPTDILSTQFVDAWETQMSLGKNSYFISGNTYTIVTTLTGEDGSGSMKLVFDKNLVISHYEMKASSQGLSVDMKFDFKYE